jgi:glycosyltransferase involved in cell wall biosynthesis
MSVGDQNGLDRGRRNVWHVLATTPVDFDKFRRESDADRMPRHLLSMIADGLDAELHVPDPSRVTRTDRVLSRIYGSPYHWEMARRVLPTLSDGDGVFTTGCDAGVPLALLCAIRRRRVAFAINFIAPSRLRTRLAGWVLVLTLQRVLAMAALDEQTETLATSFGRRATAVATIGYTTDCSFFRPAGDGAQAGVSSHADPADRHRPLVAGCGTEQRDYATLADAVATMDVDCSICFVSPNFSSKTQFTVPEPVPANMEFRHYEFAELRELYRSALVTVVPTLENTYSAGLTALFEAIACECPVVITDTPGLIREMIDANLVIGVDPGSVDGLSQGIKVAITERAESKDRARRAREFLIGQYSTDEFRRKIQILLEELIADEFSPSERGAPELD